MPRLNVIPHYEDLFPTPTSTYRERVAHLLETQFAAEPWYDWIKASLRHPCLGAADADPAAIIRRLAALCRQPVVGVVTGALERLTGLVTPETEEIACHLHPGRAPDRGGGLSFAPGKLLLGVAISDDWQGRLERGLAHEYSHTLRMAIWPQDTRHGYGAARALTVRDYLVFEGLAEALADELYPYRGLMPDDLPPPVEAAYWTFIGPQLDATGWPAYIDYILCGSNEDLPGMAGYRVGAQIIRSYMRRHGLPAVGIQKFGYEELYWDSAYPHIQ